MEFPYVYVTADGLVRELSPKEQEYLDEQFEPGDGGRPYVKRTFDELDGWGCRAGFLARSKLPAGTAVQPVNPKYDEEAARLKDDPFCLERAAGDTIVKHPDGTWTVQSNPGLTPAERLKKMTDAHLERQRRRDRIALRQPRRE